MDYFKSCDNEDGFWRDAALQMELLDSTEVEEERHDSRLGTKE